MDPGNTSRPTTQENFQSTSSATVVSTGGNPISRNMYSTGNFAPVSASPSSLSPGQNHATARALAAGSSSSSPGQSVSRPQISPGQWAMPATPKCHPYDSRSQWLSGPSVIGNGSQGHATLGKEARTPPPRAQISPAPCFSGLKKVLVDSGASLSRAPGGGPQSAASSQRTRVSISPWRLGTGSFEEGVSGRTGETNTGVEDVISEYFPDMLSSENIFHSRALGGNEMQAERIRAAGGGYDALRDSGSAPRLGSSGMSLLLPRLKNAERDVSPIVTQSKFSNVTSSFSVSSSAASLTPSHPFSSHNFPALYPSFLDSGSVPAEIGSARSDSITMECSQPIERPKNDYFFNPNQLRPVRRLYDAAWGAPNRQTTPAALLRRQTVNANELARFESAEISQDISKSNDDKDEDTSRKVADPRFGELPSLFSRAQTDTLESLVRSSSGLQSEPQSCSNEYDFLNYGIGAEQEGLRAPKHEAGIVKPAVTDPKLQYNCFPKAQVARGETRSVLFSPTSLAYSGATKQDFLNERERSATGFECSSQPNSDTCPNLVSPSEFDLARQRAQTALAEPVFGFGLEAGATSPAPAFAFGLEESKVGSANCSATGSATILSSYTQRLKRQEERGQRLLSSPERGRSVGKIRSATTSEVEGRNQSCSSMSTSGEVFKELKSGRLRRERSAEAASEVRDGKLGKRKAEEILSRGVEKSRKLGHEQKRQRAAEVHILSERKRRDRINLKLRRLQELLPHCTKTDKASILDEAIEYLKCLQSQLQLMSMKALTNTSSSSAANPQLPPGISPFVYSHDFSFPPGFPLTPSSFPQIPPSSTLSSRFPNQPPSSLSASVLPNLSWYGNLIPSQQQAPEPAAPADSEGLDPHPLMPEPAVSTSKWDETRPAEAEKATLRARGWLSPGGGEASEGPSQTPHSFLCSPRWQNPKPPSLSSSTSDPIKFSSAALARSQAFALDQHSQSFALPPILASSEPALGSEASGSLKLERSLTAPPFSLIHSSGGERAAPSLREAIRPAKGETAASAAAIGDVEFPPLPPPSPSTLLLPPSFASSYFPISLPGLPPAPFPSPLSYNPYNTHNSHGSNHPYASNNVSYPYGSISASNWYSSAFRSSGCPSSLYYPSSEEGNRGPSLSAGIGQAPPPEPGLGSEGVIKSEPAPLASSSVSAVASALASSSPAVTAAAGAQSGPSGSVPNRILDRPGDSVPNRVPPSIFGAAPAPAPAGSLDEFLGISRRADQTVRDGNRSRYSAGYDGLAVPLGTQYGAGIIPPLYHPQSSMQSVLTLDQYAELMLKQQRGQQVQIKSSSKQRQPPSSSPRASERESREEGGRIGDSEGERVTTATGTVTSAKPLQLQQQQVKQLRHEQEQEHQIFERHRQHQPQIVEHPRAQSQPRQQRQDPLQQPIFEQPRSTSQPQQQRHVPHQQQISEQHQQQQRELQQQQQQEQQQQQHQQIFDHQLYQQHWQQQQQEQIFERHQQQGVRSVSPSAFLVPENVYRYVQDELKELNDQYLLDTPDAQVEAAEGENVRGGSTWESQQNCFNPQNQ